VLLHALADHRAVEHVESGKQRGRSIALIVVRHRPAASSGTDLRNPRRIIRAVT